MRIAWFTPWTPESAIGDFSALVISALQKSQGVDVDVFHPVGAGGRAEPVPGREIDLWTLRALRGYDAVVYNIGNHLGFHGAIYETSLACPGTVILHDVVLTGLFLPLLRALRDSEMQRILTDWYGAAGPRQAVAIREDPEGWLWAAGNANRFPMLEPVLEGATQVITHSQYAAGIVRERFVGDIHTLGLPALHVPEPDARPAAFGWSDERPIVLQAGAVNPNKCIPLILQAFREHDLGDDLQLVIAGHVTRREQSRMEREVAQTGLERSVRILGAVDDCTMNSLRHAATIATVLRSPVTESSSAVLIDSLAHGLATLAVDVGHYREHPPEVVELVPAPPSASAIGEVLHRWAHDPVELVRRGEAATRYAQRYHSAEAYARELLRILPSQGSARRRNALAADAAALVARNGFASDSALGARVAEQAVFLFANEPRQGRP